MSEKKMLPLCGCGPQVKTEFGEEALRIEGQEVGDLAALAIEIPHQLAGDVHHAQPSLNVGDIKDLVLDPEVVATGFRNLSSAPPVAAGSNHPTR